MDEKYAPQLRANSHINKATQNFEQMRFELHRINNEEFVSKLSIDEIKAEARRKFNGRAKV